MPNEWNIFNHSTLPSIVSLEKLNWGADALCRRHLLLFQLDACVLGVEYLKSLYANDEYFRVLYSACLKHLKEDFLIQDEYLFKGIRLCILKCGIRELLIREVHGGSLESHFRENKTLIMLRDHYY